MRGAFRWPFSKFPGIFYFVMNEDQSFKGHGIFFLSSWKKRNLKALWHLNNGFILNHKMYKYPEMCYLKRTRDSNVSKRPVV